MADLKGVLIKLNIHRHFTSDLLHPRLILAIKEAIIRRAEYIIQSLKGEHYLPVA